MRTKNLFRSVCVCSFSACFASGAGAQVVYKMIDLGPTNELFIPTYEDNTFGINVHGEVAFTRVVDVDPGGGVTLKAHAHLFLPQAAYGLAAGIHDLHDLSGLSGSDISFGNDISDDGYVVGASGSSISTPQARLWRVPDYSVTVPTDSLHAPDIDYFDGTALNADTLDISIAHAITNGVPGENDVYVVGIISVDLCEDVGPDWGFSVEVPSSGTPTGCTALRATGPLFTVNSNTRSAAHGVNESVRSVGHDHGVNDGHFCDDCTCTGTFLCLGQGDAGELGCGWDADAATPPSPDDLDAIDPAAAMAPDNTTLAMDINDAFNAVGWGNETDGPACVNRAAYWPDASAAETPLTLGSVMPSGEDGDESRAYAVNEPEFECVMVGGGNLGANSATLWLGDGADFCARNLDGATWKCGFDSAQITWAHDVNDWGWVVGTATVDEDPSGGVQIATHAVLLVQAGDINLDGTVDGGDLGLIIAASSPPAACTPPYCLEDIDCVDGVDGGDTGLLLSNWGDSREIITYVLDCEYCDVEELQEREGQAEPMGLDDAMFMVGFESFEAMQEWNDEATLEQRQGVGWMLAQYIRFGEID
jgi:hypothetical protein